jgi:ABC-type Fe3+ transport system permease subunit
MVRLVVSSFQEPETGRLTLQNYVEAYGRARHLQALWNTLQFGAGVAALSCLFGVPLAWAISRTDMPAKNFIRLMVFGAFIIPPYLGAIGWILLAGPNAGWLNKLWMAATGAESGLFNVYSMAGLIVVVAVTSFPYVFVFTSSRSTSSPPRWRTPRTFWAPAPCAPRSASRLPLVLPAIVGGLIISFLEAIALFGAPALIALPARFHVVSTQLWQFFEYPVRVEQAAAYAMPLLLITLLMFWLQRSVLGRRGYTTVSGKGGERRIIRLGPWRFVMLGYALFVCALAVLLPMIVLTQAAFARAWGPRLLAGKPHLQNFRYILFEQTQAQNAIINTFWYSGITAFAAIGLALAIAYVVTRKLVPWSNVLAFLCMAPFVIPGHRAGDRLLRGLCAAAARALRHRHDPDPRLHHALPADRLYVERGRHAQHQSRDGRGRAHPRRRPADRDPQGAGAAVEAKHRGRLDPGVHPGDARALLGDLPGRTADARDLGDAVRPFGGGQFRGAVRARHDPAGRDADHRGDRLPRDRPRLHGALLMSKLSCAGSRSGSAPSRRSRGSTWR